MNAVCHCCGRSFDGAVAETPERHRLAIGDAAGPMVRNLFGTRLAGLVFTSPPYDQQRSYDGARFDWFGLMTGVFGNLRVDDDAQVLVNLGLVHKNHEWQPYWQTWLDWMVQVAGWRRFGLYVWDQGPGMPGDWAGRLAPSFELIFHFNRNAVPPVKARENKHAGAARGAGQRSGDGSLKDWTGGSDYVISDRSILDSVIRVNRQGSSAQAEGHPAPFPIGLPDAIIRSWPGLVYDPFAGSGTTMAAAEGLGRPCYAMEISPDYSAIVLERMARRGLAPERTL